MILQHLSLQHFRNYEQLEIALSPTINLITGNNGQGKTNLVEAIYYLCHLDSFRTHKSSQLMQSGHKVAILRGKIQKQQVFHHVQVSLSRQGKRVMLNHVLAPRISEYIQEFFALVFTPEDVSLFRSSPQARRKFFDRILCFLDPGYLAGLQKYNQVVSQRNALLRRKSLGQLDLWDGLLAEASVPLMQRRQSFVDEVNESLSQAFEKMTGRSEMLRLTYRPSVTITNSSPEPLLAVYAKSRDREVQYGYSMVGPHRDEYQLFLDDYADRDFFSQGELKITNLSLKMAINQILSLKYELSPLWVLDDLFSELDATVGSRLLSFLSEIGNQVFITSAVLPSHWNIDAKQWNVVNGAVSQQILA